LCVFVPLSVFSLPASVVSSTSKRCAIVTAYAHAICMSHFVALRSRPHTAAAAACYKPLFVQTCNSNKGFFSYSDFH